MNSIENTDMVSIIVPVYNAEKRLRRCLDSILCQTYDNFEVIIVDDGSTDHSGEICNEYAEKDSRIKVLHIQNSGVSRARNYALERTSGDYLMFVDSDDWIDQEMCAEMLAEAKESNADMLVTNAHNWDENGQRQDDDASNPKVRQIDLVKEFSFLEPYALGVVWGTLYKRECIQNLRFDSDLFVGEDTVFFAAAVKRSGRFFYSEKKYYNYVVYDNSAAHGKISDARMTNLLAWERVASLFTENVRIRDTAKGAYGRQCVYFIKELDNSSTYYSTCKEGIRKNIRYMMLTPNLKTKVDFLGYYVSPKIWGTIRGLLKH